MRHYALMFYAKKNPDLFDKDEVLDHIKEEEITLEHYEYKAVECVNDAIDLLTESAQKKSLITLIDGTKAVTTATMKFLMESTAGEFASVVMNEVKQKFRRINT